MTWWWPWTAKPSNLTDVYDLSRNVNVGAVVLLDIRRWGQVLTLVLPALQAPPPVRPHGRPAKLVGLHWP